MVTRAYETCDLINHFLYLYFKSAIVFIHPSQKQNPAMSPSFQ